MKPYQIYFEKNKAVSANSISKIYGKSVETEINEGKRTIKWITLFAEDEQDAINVANEVVESIIGIM